MNLEWKSSPAWQREIAAFAESVKHLPYMEAEANIVRHFTRERQVEAEMETLLSAVACWSYERGVERGIQVSKEMPGQPTNSET
jgi:hypothetical protein